jgi:hypothetical protein
MKTFTTVLILLHGAIHLMGAARAFDFIQAEGAAVSRMQGVVWLMAFIMFAAAGAGYLAERSYWPVPALAGVIVSVIMIAGVWSEAKWGMIPNIFILLTAFAGLSSCSMNRMIARETDLLRERGAVASPRVIKSEDMDSLPAPVARWLNKSGIVGREEIFNAECRQQALMKMKPDQKDWYEATAYQLSTSVNPGFIWTVNMNMSPLVKVRGRDKYISGKGGMKIRINNLFNVVNETGDKLDQSTLQRFLGELVWMPTLALSPHIRWESIDAYSARATMDYMGVSGSGTFYFNEEGDFTKFEALRYNGNKPDSKQYPWIITVDAYEVFDGIKVPSKMEATWVFDDGAWTWLKLRVVSVRYNI